AHPRDCPKPPAGPGATGSTTTVAATTTATAPTAITAAATTAATRPAGPQRSEVCRDDQLRDRPLRGPGIAGGRLEDQPPGVSGWGGRCGEQCSGSLYRSATGPGDAAVHPHD